MDTPLNARGVQQAKECANHLSGEKYDALITSPLQRAKQTAEIINERLHLPVIEMKEFAERCYGEAQGMTREKRQEVFPGRDYPGLEPWEALKKRAMNGLQTIAENDTYHRVLLVSHGGVINAILAIISGGKIGSGITKLVNACISDIIWEQEQWKIQAFNQTSHLSVYDKRE